MVDNAFSFFTLSLCTTNHCPTLAGDYSNDYKPSFNASVDVIANAVKQGQAAFDKRQTKKQVALPKSQTARVTPKNKAQQRNALHDEIKSLDELIAEKTATKVELQAQLERLTVSK